MYPLAYHLDDPSLICCDSCGLSVFLDTRCDCSVRDSHFYSWITTENQPHYGLHFAFSNLDPAAVLSLGPGKGPFPRFGSND